MPQIALSSLILLVSLGLSVACKKDKLENLSVPRLILETRDVDYGAASGQTVTLPVSRTTVSIQGYPVVNEFDILNVEMVKVDMGVALLVQTGGQGARDLYRASVSNMGSRIVFMVNGNAIGARRIDGAIQDGNFYTFVEVDDEELGQLVLDIKETIVKLQANK
ncbi:MAG: hypothetical protein VXY17_01495 [Verrucomicrobiota bacterium]|nr:hypothetical protein [Verrucomicrobiota bacterium]MEC8614064.1 hypothetical protein [Verrucomicrobiota bacterium]